MPDVVSNGRDEEGEGVKGLEEFRDGRFCRFGVGVAWGIRRQGADADEKVEEGLENVDDVSKVVVLDKLVVGGTTGQEEDDEFIWDS
jgi:hypothetical protein